MRVLRSPRDVPVAGHDHLAFLSQLAADVHGARLNTALQAVAVAGDAICIVEPRLGGPVDFIDVDDGKLRLANDEDAAFEIARIRFTTTPMTVTIAIYRLIAASESASESGEGE